MYCTLDDIIAATDKQTVAQWTDDVAGVEISKEVVATAIKKAGGVIDSYLSTRYVVPLASSSDVVRGYCTDIAVYLLATRRPDLNASDDVKDAKNAAVAWCKDVAAGRANVVGATVPTPANQAKGSYSTDEREYTRDTMKGF